MSCLNPVSNQTPCMTMYSTGLQMKCQICPSPSHQASEGVAIARNPCPLPLCSIPNRPAPSASVSGFSKSEQSPLKKLVAPYHTNENLFLVSLFVVMFLVSWYCYTKIHGQDNRE